MCDDVFAIRAIEEFTKQREEFNRLSVLSDTLLSQTHGRRYAVVMIFSTNHKALFYLIGRIASHLLLTSPASRMLKTVLKENKPMGRWEAKLVCNTRNGHQMD
jgi:hypothetical protein